ncbi:SDR family oxidoreductase [Rhodohalobacter halophilus]|uniref:SDR family oxidoreductase n=1 Tax=Rhodohalobacter halophilus TaxID=1812810 RepID=UPI00083F71FD|nr:SDR family NAD(P)-dependent oxidoreductase [Rhodohalobacter halophilus]
MEIQGRTAIVTGASRGIGLAISKALIREGVTVAGWSRTPPESFSHKQFYHIKTDLTKEDSVRIAFDETVNRVGSSIPILINNAGMGYRGPTDEMPSEQWRRLFDLNVHGLFYTSKQVIPQMKVEKRGHIINIGSGAGTNGIAEMSCYCGTKFAVNGITQSLHQELRNFGIKVSCLSPGSVETGFSQSKKNKLLPEDLAASVIHMLKCPKNFHYTDIQVRPLQP